MRGGNDQITDRLAAALDGQITTGSELVAVRRTAAGRWELTFEQGAAFAGVEGEREETAHFAGEHTSLDSQGYLSGAVESGQRAAAEILADLK